MAGDTTFTFLDAAGATKTARAGSDAGNNLAPSAVLYDVNGNVLIGQKARAASLPVALSTEDAALIDQIEALLGALGTQTTLAAVLAQLVAGIPVTGNVEVTNDAGNPLPISGSVTANLGTIGGVATETTLATMLTLAGFQARINTLGQKTMANSTPVALSSDQSVIPASLRPETSGGLSVYRNLDTGTTGANPKGSAGQLYGYYLYNNASSARFVKLYDKASAPTNSDTPVITIPLPAGSAANVSFPNGVAFANGIGLRASTGIADNDTGAPSANDVVVNLLYK